MKQRIQIYLVLTGMLLLAHPCFAASTVQFSSRVLTVAEDAGQAELTVVRANDTDTLVAVEFFSIEATATADLDYTTVSGAVTFQPGETNQTIVVPLLNDGHIEPVERFQVALTNVTGDAVLGLMRVATISIRDNETPVQLEFTTYWAREDEGFVQIGFVRGGDELESLTLEIATADGTAKAGEDYSAISGTMEFGTGESLALVNVPILNDGIKEAEETFRVYLTNAPAGMLGTLNTATVRIQDNDPGIQFERGKLWVQEDEGQLTVKVVRGNDVDLPECSVDYATSNHTAVAGVDYVETNGTLRIAAGEAFGMISVPVHWNHPLELDVQFTIRLSNPTVGVVFGANSIATVTILDVTGVIPHGFAEITVTPEQGSMLALIGEPHRRFAPFFDVYPVEISADLLTWTPLVTRQRANSSSNALSCADDSGANARAGYYRQPVGFFINLNDWPDGPYPVGRLNRWVTDSTRRNRFLVSNNSSFQVSVWYPATPKAGCWPAPYLEESILRDENYWGAWLDRAPHFKGYAVDDLELAEDLTPFPIVLLSHGWEGIRGDLFEQGEVLASHGYVVVAPDHSDATAVVLPNGNYEFRNKGVQLTEAGLRDRVRDFSFLVDQLEQWSVSDPRFAGRLDLGKIAAMGFSWGGATALEFCRADTRCRAAVALDPGGFTTPELPQYGLQKPSLTINRSDNGDFSLYDKAAADAVWFQISNTTHGDIGGWAWWPNGTLAAVQNAAEVNRSANVFTVWFLNKHLRGSAEAMPVLADYPRIINFKQK